MILYFIIRQPLESTKNLNYCALIWPSNASSSLVIDLAMKPLKFGTYSMRWRMVRTDLTSMKDFMSNGIVGKFSFLKDILHLPNDASILLYVWLPHMKFSSISLNMPFTISKDQKQNTNWFLLSSVALCIWTFKMESNDRAKLDVSHKGGNDVLYIFVPCNTTSNRRLDLDYSNSQWDDDLEGISKSQRSFTNKSVIWFELCAKRSRL